jgi:transcriptional regulator
MDEKQPLDKEKLFYTIGEVSQILGVEPSTLRYWETEFKQLTPSRTQRGRRQYKSADIEVLRRIYHLVRVEGIAIDQAKKRLAVMGDKEQQRIEAIAKLVNVKRLLAQLRDIL